MKSPSLWYKPHKNVTKKENYRLTSLDEHRWKLSQQNTSVERQQYVAKIIHYDHMGFVPRIEG